jgi:hypothetical protein
MVCLFMLSCLILASSVVTDSIVRRLRSLVAGRPLHPWFFRSFFHARFFLEMAVRYASVDALPRSLPCGCAVLLYLY